MHLLGYKKQGYWRDPTLFYPKSYVRYYRGNSHIDATPALDKADNTIGISTQHPQDTLNHQRNLATSIEQLSYRIPLLKLDHDVWELPALRGKPIHIVNYAINTFRRREKAHTRITPRPAVNKPLEKVLYFPYYSAHFQYPAQASHELDKIVEVLKRFPQLKVTIQGNIAAPFSPELRGNGSYSRMMQEELFPPKVTKWKTEVESYTSDGQLMDSRAHTVQRYLINHGINSSRVHTSRGRYTEARTFTIIFSK